MNLAKRISVLVTLIAMSLAIASQVAAGGSPYQGYHGNVIFKKAGAFTESIDMLFDVKEGGELLLGTTNGSVKINTWSKNQIRLVITKTTNASNAFNARTILEDFLVQTRHRGKNLHLKAEANTEACKKSVGVVFTVWVPKNYNVDIKTGRGNVDIGKLNGSFSAKTADGKITFECEPTGMDIEVEDNTRETSNGETATETDDGEPDKEPSDPQKDDARTKDSGSGRL